MIKREWLHRLSYRICRPVAKMLLRKYSFRSGPVPEMDEPYILMANHTTEVDMLMLMAAFPKHMYYVCGEHLFRSKVAKPLRFFINPIPAPRGGVMNRTIIEMLKRIKNGNNIMMFPEGSRSFNGITIDIPPATGKVVKKAGCALITYRTRGGYFVAPRWAYNFRRGHMEGEVVNVYSSQQLKSMSAEEVNAAINADIFENAYDSQAKTPYAYIAEAPAEGLENFLIICPKCGAYDSMQSSGDSFSCSCCGMGGRYDEYGYLVGEGLSYNRVDEWGRWIEQRFDEDMDKRGDEELLFTEKDIRLYEILPDHSTRDLDSGEVQIYKGKIVMGEREFAFDDILAMSLLYYGKSVLFTHGDASQGKKDIYYGMTGESFHAWKIERLYKTSRKNGKDGRK